MLEPEELEGSRLRDMLRGNPQFDLSRPIPVDRLVSEANRMWGQRTGGGDSGRGRPSFGGGGGPWGGGGPPFGGGGPPFGGGGPPFGGGGPPFGGGGPPFGGDWRGRDSGRDSRGGEDSSPYRPRETKVEPLVPGFGVASMSTAPPGFGAEADLFSIPVTEEDRREAEDAFRRYDRNRNGKIDADEIRSGSDLPMFDRNRDGSITMKEMEYRYAYRRIENQREDRARSGSSGNARRDDERRRDGDRRSGGDEEEQAGSTDAGSAERKSYRRKPPLERLPEGIPDWFPRDDADGDGQIAMSEFSASWTDGVLAEFNQFDLNRDGLITPSECMAAKNQGAVRGGSIGATVAAPSATAAPPDAGASTARSAASGAPASSVPAGGGSAAVGARPADIDARSYEFFKQVVIKADTNNDGELTANEWVNMSKNPEAADADKNGRITVEEYARWKLQR
jgi:Ca2+-binding EF-hand superfamily protein